MGHPKRETIVFKPSMFRGYLSFREGIFVQKNCQALPNHLEWKPPEKTNGTTSLWWNIGCHSIPLMWPGHSFCGRAIHKNPSHAQISLQKLPQIQKRLATSSKKRPKHLHCLRCVGVCRRSKKYIQNQRSSARVEAAEWLSLIEPWVPNHGLNPGRHLT